MCERKDHPNYYRCECPSAAPQYRAAQARARYAATRTGAGAVALEPQAPDAPEAETAWQPEAIRTLSATVSDWYATADTEAGAALTAEFGSPLAAVRHIGALATRRSEELAGITGEQARADDRARREPAVAELKAATDLLTAERALALTVFKARMESEGQPSSWQWRRADDDDPDSPKARYEAHLYDFTYETQARVAAANDAIQAADTAAAADRTRLAAAYREALAEIRPMGGSLVTHELSGKKAVEIAGRAAQVYPTQWLAVSEEAGPVTVDTSAKRAHASAVGISSDKVEAKPSKGYVKAGAVVGDRLDRELTLSRRGVGRGGEPDPAYDEYDVQEYDISVAKKMPSGPGWEPILEGGRWMKGQRYKLMKPGEGWRRKKRGRVEGAGFTINTDANGIDGEPRGFAVAAHELGHHMQNVVPGISEMEADWIRERTTVDGVQQHPRPISPRSTEMVRPDNFVHSYIGRVYKDGAGNVRKSTEVITVGVQAMFGGDLGGLIGTGGQGQDLHDDDMRALVLGMMLSAGAPRG